MVQRRIVPFKLVCTFQSSVLATTEAKGTSHYSIDCFQVCFSSVLNMIGIAVCMNVASLFLSEDCAAIPSTVAGRNAVQEEGPLCTPLDFFPAGPGTRWLLVLGICNCSWQLNSSTFDWNWQELNSCTVGDRTLCCQFWTSRSLVPFFWGW